MKFTKLWDHSCIIALTTMDGRVGRDSAWKGICRYVSWAAAREINYVAQKFSKLQIKSGSVFQFGRSLTGGRNCRTIEHRSIAKVYYRL